MKASDKTKLRRARRTLRFMSEYFYLQESEAKAGRKSPGVSWRKIYEDVSHAAREWCKAALKES